MALGIRVTHGLCMRGQLLRTVYLIYSLLLHTLKMYTFIIISSFKTFANNTPSFCFVRNNIVPGLYLKTTACSLLSFTLPMSSLAKILGNQWYVKIVELCRIPIRNCSTHLVIVTCLPASPESKTERTQLCTPGQSLQSWTRSEAIVVQGK